MPPAMVKKERLERIGVFISDPFFQKGYTTKKVEELRKKRQEEEKRREEEEKQTKLSMSREVLIGSMTLFLCVYCECPCDSMAQLEDHLFICESNPENVAN